MPIDPMQPGSLLHALDSLTGVCSACGGPYPRPPWLDATLTDETAGRRWCGWHDFRPGVRAGVVFWCDSQHRRHPAAAVLPAGVFAELTGGGLVTLTESGVRLREYDAEAAAYAAVGRAVRRVAVLGGGR